MPQGLPGGSGGSPAGAAPPRAGRTAIAWTAIAVLVAVVAGIQMIRPPEDDGGVGFATKVMETQVRLQYGIHSLMVEFAGSSAQPQDFKMLREAIGRGPAPIRQRLAVVAGDLVGPAAAREELDTLEELLRARGRGLTPAESAIQEDLRRLYDGDDVFDVTDAAGAVTAERRAALRAGLGWFGDLALSPEGTPGREAIEKDARRLAVIAVAAGLGALALFGIGCVAALVYWLRAMSRGTGFLMQPGGAPHGIYAETFAVWLASFLLLAVAAAFGAELLPEFPGRGFVLNVTLPFLTLFALAWPVLRGVPFAQVRRDIGFRFSATPFRDAWAGLLCWLAALPLLAVAALGTAVVAGVAAAITRKGKPDELELAQSSSHPLGDEIAGGLSWPAVLLLASVVAPILEETFFRGVLYRHLRDATRARGAVASIAISAVISGIVFGAVHPQGLLAAPLLAAVAWPLVHAREWRDSLVAPITAHAVHNAVITGVAWLMLAS